MATRDDLHVLLVTPTGRDAELIAHVLGLSDVKSEILSDVADAVDAFRTKDVGAMLIGEEALESDAIALMSSALSRQPAWSTIPVLILTKSGKQTLQSLQQQKRREPLGDVTLLERPIRTTTLVSSVKAALRARSDQYVRRNAEMVLRQNEKLAAVGRVASSIAHEINNPLEAVTNLLYLLKGTPLNEEQQGLLDMAERELARVSEISSHTLTFNRQRHINGEASIPDLLDSVLVLYHGRMAGSGIRVERRYRHSKPLTCRPGELRQVFANLIGNAFDAIRTGGRILLRERPATDLRTGRQGVRVTVADTGYGMGAHVKATCSRHSGQPRGSMGVDWASGSAKESLKSIAVQFAFALRRNQEAVGLCFRFTFLMKLHPPSKAPRVEVCPPERHRSSVAYQVGGIENWQLSSTFALGTRITGRNNELSLLR